MVLAPPGPAPRGEQRVPSDTFLELFFARGALRPTEIVYYYDASRIEANGFVFVPLIGGGYYVKQVLSERLWLLLDESTGVVEDYVVRGPE